MISKSLRNINGQFVRLCQYLSYDASEFVMPATRALLLEHNIDVKWIRGTGCGGRVMKYDVLEYLKHPSNPISENVPKEDMAAVDLPEKIEKPNDRTLAHVQPEYRDSCPSYHHDSGYSSIVKEIRVSSLLHSAETLSRSSKDPMVFQNTIDSIILKSFSLSVFHSLYYDAFHTNFMSMSTHNQVIQLSLSNTHSVSDIIKSLVSSQGISNKQTPSSSFSLQIMNSSHSHFCGGILYSPNEIGTMNIGGIYKQVCVPFAEEGSSNQSLETHSFVTATWTFDEAKLDNEKACELVNEFCSYLESPMRLMK